MITTLGKFSLIQSPMRHSLIAMIGTEAQRSFLDIPRQINRT